MSPEVAVWTADCSATVQLARCNGPREGLTSPPACWTRWCHADVAVPLDLAQRDHKVALYECCLRHGTAFDIYRWVNLPDLTLLWPSLDLPADLRSEWGSALARMGLLQQR